MTVVDITLLGRFAVAVDGVPSDPAHWTRRHAAGLVKLLALAPGRRLHREQVLERLWPDEPIGQSAPKLHKAAHFARRALDLPCAVLLRADTIVLAPEAEVTTDVERFERLAAAALAAADPGPARAALAAYGGELLPDDRYADWAEARRDQLSRTHLDLLRLAGRWEQVIDIDDTDEPAHLALMRRYADSGDRHAALRQFERMDRALRRGLGVAPGESALRLRNRLLADQGPGPAGRVPIIGRDAELARARKLLLDTAFGRSRTLLISGPAGVGKSTMVAAIAARAVESGFAVGQGASNAVEGAWPYAPVVEALGDMCRHHPGLLDGLRTEHRQEIDRALAGAELTWTGASSHQRLFVAATELVRLAAASTGVLITVDDVHEADDASLRLLHYISRSTRDQRVCLVLAHRPAPRTGALADTRRSLLERHGGSAIELGPLGVADAAALVRRLVPQPSPELLDRITALGRGIPFAINELARRATGQSRQLPELDVAVVRGLPSTTREVLQRVAVLGVSFDTDEFVALSRLSEEEAFEHLDSALAALMIERCPTGYRFRHQLVREALLEPVPPLRRRRMHADAARRLIELGASAARIGHHLRESGAGAEAVPYLLRAAETEAAVGAYRDALALVEAVRPDASGANRATVLALRADLLNAIGDPMATTAYREALDAAEPAAVRRLRVRLAHSAVMSGDLETTAAALAGLDTDGAADDADILLARGKYAYFNSDFPAAQAIIDRAQRLVLTTEPDWKVLDLVALQGLLAHRTGRWFGQMRRELYRTRDNPEIANTVYDGYLCAAEFMLYGPTPYAEVMEVARDLQLNARRSGALRAEAFAAALTGEAALLSGDLERAASALTEARDLHHDLGSGGGEAHSLQRLAELHLARGDAETARRLLWQALPLARESVVGRHLLQRIFGTLVLAADDPDEARVLVDRAEATIGWDDACAFCSIMLAVPATIACARAGDLVAARNHLEAAHRAAEIWRGTSWEAGLAEAEAAVATAAGEIDSATQRLRAAAEIFDRAGQPRDAQRCREALTRL
jgi:DNA-binding SARP family transcriptional activator/tetratricopeptide (TPR) repeat protein